MQRCKHNQLDITTLTARTIEWRNGEVFNNGDDTFNGCRIVCKDCGYQKTFGNEETFPKWLQIRWAEILESDAMR